MRIRAFTLAGAYAFLLCCIPALAQMAQNDPSVTQSMLLRIPTIQS